METVKAKTRLHSPGDEWILKIAASRKRFIASKYKPCDKNRNKRAKKLAETGYLNFKGTERGYRNYEITEKGKTYLKELSKKDKHTHPQINISKQEK